jgi:4-amino-4-deoxy-L-arabinose transferase-like glycosyltransferase
MAIAGLIGLAVLAVGRTRLFTEEGRYRRTLALLLAGVVGTGILLVAFVPTIPFSDFASYLKLACRFATGEPLPPVENARFFQAWGYPVALAPFMAMFGNPLLVAKVLNIVMGCGSLLLLVAVATRAAGRRVGLLTGLLFLAWPARVLLVTVVASEHLALLLTLACMLCLIRVLDGRGHPWRWALLAGVFGAASAAVRPASGVSLPAGVLAILLTRSADDTFRARLARVACVVAGFVVTTLIYLASLHAIYGRTPPAVAWWSLMAGTNAQTNGMWNREDIRRFGSYADLGEANRFARQEALRRITADPAGYLRLVCRKVRVLWETIDPNCALAKLEPSRVSGWLEHHRGHIWGGAQFLHVGGLILALVGLGLVWRQGLSPGMALLLLLTLGGTAVHAVFETQARYHYVFAVTLLILGACAIDGARGLGGLKRVRMIIQCKDRSADWPE